MGLNAAAACLLLCSAQTLGYQQSIHDSMKQQQEFKLLEEDLLHISNALDIKDTSPVVELNIMEDTAQGVGMDTHPWEVSSSEEDSTEIQSYERLSAEDAADLFGDGITDGDASKVADVMVHDSFKQLLSDNKGICGQIDFATPGVTWMVTVNLESSRTPTLESGPKEVSKKVTIVGGLYINFGFVLLTGMISLEAEWKYKNCKNFFHSLEVFQAAESGKAIVKNEKLQKEIMEKLKAKMAILEPLATPQGEKGKALEWTPKWPVVEGVAAPTATYFANKAARMFNMLAKKVQKPNKKFGTYKWLSNTTQVTPVKEVAGQMMNFVAWMSHMLIKQTYYWVFGGHQKNPFFSLFKEKNKYADVNGVEHSTPDKVQKDVEAIFAHHLKYDSDKKTFGDMEGENPTSPDKSDASGCDTFTAQIKWKHEGDKEMKGETFAEQYKMINPSGMSGADYDLVKKVKADGGWKPEADALFTGDHFPGVICRLLDSWVHGSFSATFSWDMETAAVLKPDSGAPLKHSGFCEKGPNNGPRVCRDSYTGGLLGLAPKKVIEFGHQGNKLYLWRPVSNLFPQVSKGIQMAAFHLDQDWDKAAPEVAKAHLQTIASRLQNLLDTASTTMVMDARVALLARKDVDDAFADMKDFGAEGAPEDPDRFENYVEGEENIDEEEAQEGRVHKETKTLKAKGGGMSAKMQQVAVGMKKEEIEQATVNRQLVEATEKSMTFPPKAKPAFKLDQQPDIPELAEDKKVTIGDNGIQMQPAQVDPELFKDQYAAMMNADLTSNPMKPLKVGRFTLQTSTIARKTSVWAGLEGMAANVAVEMEHLLNENNDNVIQSEGECNQQCSVTYAGALTLTFSAMFGLPKAIAAAGGYDICTPDTNDLQVFLNWNWEVEYAPAWGPVPAGQGIDLGAAAFLTWKMENICTFEKTRTDAVELEVKGVLNSNTFATLGSVLTNIGISYKISKERKAITGLDKMGGKVDFATAELDKVDGSKAKPTKPAKNKVKDGGLAKGKEVFAGNALGTLKLEFYFAKGTLFGWLSDLGKAGLAQVNEQLLTPILLGLQTAFEKAFYDWDKVKETFDAAGKAIVAALEKSGVWGAIGGKLEAVKKELGAWVTNPLAGMADVLKDVGIKGGGFDLVTLEIKHEVAHPLKCMKVESFRIEQFHWVQFGFSGLPAKVTSTKIRTLDLANTKVWKDANILQTKASKEGMCSMDLG